MIVVSDTTPIVSLMKVGQLNLLEKLFGNVRIPMGVYEELTTNPKYEHEAKQIRDSPFLEVVSVQDMKSISIFRRANGLDKGESEVIGFQKKFMRMYFLWTNAEGDRWQNKWES